MTRPPGLLSLLARLLIIRKDREFVLGDLDELYAHRAAQAGRISAALGYLRDTLGVALRRTPDARGDRSGPPPEPRRGITLGDVGADLGQALRALRRRPAFTALVVATLALGVGPTIAVLGIVDQLLLRPLPGAANSGSGSYLRLLNPEEDLTEFLPEGLTLRQFDEVRAQASLLTGLASYGPTSQYVSVDGGRPISVSANTISGDFFEVLGVQPSEGRLLAGAETTLDSNPLVAVISEDLRGRLFGAGEEVIGRSLQINGQPVEVVGVAGGGFRGPVRGEARDLWLPHGALVPLAGFTRARLESPRSAMHSEMLVLPASGVGSEAVEQQVAEILKRLGEEDPERAEELLHVRPTVAEGLYVPPVGRERTYRTLTLMTWVAALLLVVACANVANLLLFQNLRRRGALATSRALGASTGRIARQQLGGSLLLAALGAAGGAALGWAIALLFRGQVLLGMPEYEGLDLNLRLVAWVGGAVVTTVALFGVVPAILAGRFDISSALRASQARVTGRLGLLRSALSAGQIALTLGLLVGGMLMVQTITNLGAVDTGVEIEGVVGAGVNLPADLDPTERHMLQRTLIQAVASEPGVERAALDLYGPHGSQSLAPVGVGTAATGTDMPRTLVWQVSPGWFELFGLGPVSGRTFEDADWRIPSTGAAVLTASLARRLFGRTNVEGQAIWVQGATPPERRVIGVVGNYTSLITVTATRPEDALRPSGPTDAVFLPFGDLPLFQMTVFVKAMGSARDLQARVQSVVEAVLTGVPSPEPYLLRDRVGRIYREEHLLGRLLLVLAGFGVLTSGVGLLAAIYFLVSSRKQELGIRVALGADGMRILGLVTRSAVAIVGVGVGAGILVAYPVSRALQVRLFGVSALDPTSYAAATAAVAVVALLACLSPVRDALRTDPVAVLRQE